ncbi:hypothetical protein [Neisseria dumasiana]|uniref:Stability determinant n=1 Tax=Neisseria dumasiana TaxID=1931275 RepID=A0A1X3D3I4_9NEIS|nr:hypothetical protein [Neisseria dumasiana]OSI14483.1 hypothetical protein BV912_12525 [Neisseria dumasiana]
MKTAVKKLDPILSAFDTKADEDAYDRWFEQQVKAGLRAPVVSHDEAMVRLDALRARLLERLRAAQN